MKPTAQQATAILDDAIPKIYAFGKLSEGERINIMTSLELTGAQCIHLSITFNRHNKELASWLMYLDEAMRRAMLNSAFGIAFSAPNKSINITESTPYGIRAAATSLVAQNKWDYLPVEYVLVLGFITFSLNHSFIGELWDFSYPNQNPLIDFNGWAEYWISAKDNNIEGRSKLADYIVTQYKF